MKHLFVNKTERFKHEIGLQYGEHFHLCPCKSEGMGKQNAWMLAEAGHLDYMTWGEYALKVVKE